MLWLNSPGLAKLLIFSRQLKRCCLNWEIYSSNVKTTAPVEHNVERRPAIERHGQFQTMEIILFLWSAVCTQLTRSLFWNHEHRVNSAAETIPLKISILHRNRLWEWKKQHQVFICRICFAEGFGAQLIFEKASSAAILSHCETSDRPTHP